MVLRNNNQIMCYEIAKFIAKAHWKIIETIKSNFKNQYNKNLDIAQLSSNSKIPLGAEMAL